MFGSDSAPHPQSAKECSGCAAGVFTAPIALPRLAELFEQHHALDKLQAFVSDNAQRIYDIQPPARLVELATNALGGTGALWHRHSHARRGDAGLAGSSSLKQASGSLEYGV